MRIKIPQTRREKKHEYLSKLTFTLGIQDRARRHSEVVDCLQHKETGPSASKVTQRVQESHVGSSDHGVSNHGHEGTHTDKGDSAGEGGSDSGDENHVKVRSRNNAVLGESIDQEHSDHTAGEMGKEGPEPLSSYHVGEERFVLEL